jgi:hypothetical protein
VRIKNLVSKNISRVKGAPDSLLVLVAYFLVMLGVLSPLRFGVGQYWDWSFPLYKSQIPEYFGKASESWTRGNTGSPLGYSSDYLLRFVISRFNFMQPETLLYLWLVVMFALTAFGVYMTLSKYRELRHNAFQFSLGLVAIFNPVIFYKLIAGHVDYFFSYCLLIWLIYFLRRKLKPDMMSYGVLGILIGLIGAQIQFFVIAAFFVVAYLVFHKELISFKGFVLSGLITLGLNIVWLVGFVTGANSLNEAGVIASKVSFKATNSTSFSKIFSFKFSDATLIARYYNKYELAGYSLLFIALTLSLAVLVRKQKLDKFRVFTVGMFVLFVVLTTGTFQLLRIPVVSQLYPMFREVGHFAPVVVLLCVLFYGSVVLAKPKRYILNSLAVFLTLLSLVTIVKVYNFPLRLSYGQLRSSFDEYKSFVDTKYDKNYSVLTYPFFDQYSYDSVSMHSSFPVSNSGHDNFTSYTGVSYIKNSIKPQDFKDSLQYTFLQDYDVERLRPYGVKYIFDYSRIMTSNYERYVPASTYFYDLSLIKNDPLFLQKIVDRNPDEVVRISEHIIEIIDAQPILGTADQVYMTRSENLGVAAYDFSKNTLKSPLLYTQSDVSGLAKFNELFGTNQPGADLSVVSDIRDEVEGLGDKSTLYIGQNQPKSVEYTYKSGALMVYAKNYGEFLVNQTNVGSATDRVLVKEVKLDPLLSYYISVSGREEYALLTEKGGVLQNIPSGSSINIYTLSRESVLNDSFEANLWEGKVRDCNKYDDKPLISMARSVKESADQNGSLELSASFHDACTVKEVELQPNATYAITMDVQAQNTDVTKVYLSFDQNASSYKSFIVPMENKQWNKFSKVFVTPEQAATGQLYLYSLGNNSTDSRSVNRYDNVRLRKVTSKVAIPLEAKSGTFAVKPLQASGKTEFNFRTDPALDKNIIKNGSFEQGAWQREVGDCSKYDERPVISMRLDKEQGSDGQNFLSLISGRHIACTNTTINVTGGADYRLAFSHKSNANTVGYHLTFNDPSVTQQSTNVTPAKLNEWQQYAVDVQVPAEATTATLHLYALENDSPIVDSRVSYDDVSMVELPKVRGSYFVVGGNESSNNTDSEMIQAQGTFQQSTSIHAENSDAFVVLLAQTFHPLWSLTSGKVKLGEETHVKINNYANGWQVSPKELCESPGSDCTSNPDGSYDIKFVTYFAAQDTFKAARLLTVGTIGFVVLSAVVRCLYTYALAKRRLNVKV